LTARVTILKVEEPRAFQVKEGAGAFGFVGRIADLASEEVGLGRDVEDGSDHGSGERDRQGDCADARYTGTATGPHRPGRAAVGANPGRAGPRPGNRTRRCLR